MSKFKMLPPLERLNELLFIDADGNLRWKKKPHSRCKHIESGAIAGSAKADGYWRVTIDGSHYYSHRIIWKIETGTDPGCFEVDHINRNRSDNRICNLRLLTPRQNCLNKCESGRGKTGESCVFNTGRRKSPFKVVVNGMHVGSFSSIRDAIVARDKHKGDVLAREGML
jgi:hypothetical protein